MYANGFFEEKRRSPAGFAAVVGVHGALLGVLALYGTTQFVREPPTIIDVTSIPLPDDPPPIPPPPSPDRPTPQQRDTPTVTERVLPTDSTVTGEITPPRPYQEPTTPPGERTELTVLNTPAIPPPIRRAAEVDPRYRDALQPPYPREQEAAQRAGQVRVRITIGTDGRVTAIEQLSATNESFWRATERQARNRWRFRPATVDGRAIVSTMTMTVTFRIPDA